MDLTGVKPTIINCSVGGWYGAGADRLQRSLIYEGFGGDIRIYKDYPAGCPAHEGDGQYNFKPYCFKEAFDSGVKVAIWADASMWCIKNPMPLLDYVNDNGIYFFKSGYSLAETATDRLLEYAQVTREELVDVSEFATGLVGINIDNPMGKYFYEQWYQYMQDGMFGGNRVHDLRDSTHPMFKFSRQDQSAASMILYKMGVITAGENQDFQAYKGTPYNHDKCLFFIGGL